MTRSARPGHRRLLSAPVTTFRPTVSSPLASEVVSFSSEPESYDVDSAPAYTSSSNTSSTSPNDSEDESTKELLRKRSKSQVHSRSKSYGDIALKAALSRTDEADEEAGLGIDVDGKLPIIPQPPPYSSIRAMPSFELDFKSSASAPRPPQRPLRKRGGLPQGSVLALVVDALLSVAIYFIFAFIVSRTSVATHLVGKTRVELEPLCKLAKKVVAESLAKGEALELVRRGGAEFALSATMDDDVKWQGLVDACQAMDAQSGFRAFLSHTLVWFTFIPIKAVLGWMTLRTCPSAIDSTRRSKPELNPALAYFYMSVLAHFIVAFLGIWLLQPSLSFEERFAFPLSLPSSASGRMISFPMFGEATTEQLSAAYASVVSGASGAGISALGMLSLSAQFLGGACIGLLALCIGAIPLFWCAKAIDRRLSRSTTPSDEKRPLHLLSEKVVHDAKPLEGSARRKAWFSSLLLGSGHRGHWEEGMVLVESYKGIKWEKRRWWVDPKPSINAAAATAACTNASTIELA